MDAKIEELLSAVAVADDDSNGKGNGVGGTGIAAVARTLVVLLLCRRRRQRSGSYNNNKAGVRTYRTTAWSLLLVAMTALGVSYRVASERWTRLAQQLQQQSSARQRKGDALLAMTTCPAAMKAGKIENFVESFDEYDDDTRKIAQDVDGFLGNFSEARFDAWNRSYRQVKEGMRHWKKTRFSGIRSGDKIYESACGIGLNLMMTLEILKEEHGVTDLAVYGNEYLQGSVDVGNMILPKLLDKVDGKLGAVCQGDSTNLTGIPDNSFDYVYTGYMSLLLDPLGFDAGDEATRQMNRALCKSTDRLDWKAQKLLDIAEERQNAWQSVWVKEMIRIAKPGAPVIVEQVTHDSCRARPDFRGLSKGWWKKAITKYGFDVDPASLDMEDDTIFRDHDYDTRYHVFMRKKNGVGSGEADATTKN